MTLLTMTTGLYFISHYFCLDQSRPKQNQIQITIQSLSLSLPHSFAISAIFGILIMFIRITSKNYVNRFQCTWFCSSLVSTLEIIYMIYTIWLESNSFSWIIFLFSFLVTFVCITTATITTTTTTNNQKVHVWSINIEMVIIYLWYMYIFMSVSILGVIYFVVFMLLPCFLLVFCFQMYTLLYIGKKKTKVQW